MKELCRVSSFSQTQIWSPYLKGLRNTEPISAPKRLPLTPDLLTRCIQTLRSGYMSPFTDKTLESMFLLAFFGFLRSSEFTTPTSVHHPSLHATISDVSIHPPDTIIYLLKRSKTNQHGPPQRVYLFRQESFPSSYEPICDYLNLRSTSRTQDPLFITETGKGATRSWFLHHFRQVLPDPAYLPHHTRAIHFASAPQPQAKEYPTTS
ncbi:hypothetical protein EYF80_038910 [Liparis tanakae]|uniref:Uncharacterized protein n=1 Tax=Liparis tanakae TaxID=230148 RepID=A0A4Z2GBC0_9TELE|nr:hypothetical protein EYF80_038910 [Liparis tanakae]